MRVECAMSAPDDCFGRNCGAGAWCVVAEVPGPKSLSRVVPGPIVRSRGMPCWFSSRARSSVSGMLDDVDPGETPRYSTFSIGVAPRKDLRAGSGRGHSLVDIASGRVG